MKRGFTIIELMIVVVIIGVLASIAIPNFVRMIDKAKAASVIANMHTTQVTVEEQSINRNQQYFPNLADFAGELPPFDNPFNSTNPSIQNESDANITGVVEYAGDLDYYTITGYGKDLSEPLMLLNQSIHSF